MKFLEKDLEEIIFNTDMKTLSIKGFSKSKHMKRQLRLGNYGIADLVGFDMNTTIDANGVIGREFHFVVYELKQDKISVSSFLQAVGYLRGVMHYLEKHHNNIYSKSTFQISLLGRNVDDKSAFIYLPYIICNESFSLTIHTYTYDVDGMIFKDHHRYNLSSPGF